MIIYIQHDFLLLSSCMPFHWPSALLAQGAIKDRLSSWLRLQAWNNSSGIWKEKKTSWIGFSRKSCMSINVNQCLQLHPFIAPCKICAQRRRPFLVALTSFLRVHIMRQKPSGLTPRWIYSELILVDFIRFEFCVFYMLINQPRSFRDSLDSLWPRKFLMISWIREYNTFFRKSIKLISDL